MKVTVNTDNPGISRTDFTNELHRASRLTPGGLSAWEILQLVRNSFRGAFVSHRISKELILKIEAEILEILRGNRDSAISEPMMIKILVSQRGRFVPTYRQSH